MGGSAGCLAAFQAAVTLKLPRKLTLVLALVENSINQNALRNDDIITMKSGRTVEVNNTDAEGRLVLGDCVSHASNSLDSTPDIIYDQATLTGAQLVAVAQLGPNLAQVGSNLAQHGPNLPPNLAQLGTNLPLAVPKLGSTCPPFCTNWAPT